MPLDKPRFRRDLEAVPIQAGGQRYVEVHDPSTGGSFQFYDFEYRVALAFDGLAFDKVIPWLKLATGLELQESELREFAARLRELGFLEPDTKGAPAELPAASIAVPVPAFEPAVADGNDGTRVQAAPVSVEVIEKPAPPPAETRGEAVPPPSSTLGEAAPARAEVREKLPASPAEAREESAPPPSKVHEETAPLPAEGLEEAAPTRAEASQEVPPPPAEVLAEAAPPLVEIPEETAAAPAEVPEEVALPPAEVPGEAAAAPVEVLEDVAPLPVEAPEEPALAPRESAQPSPIPAEARRPDSTAFPVLPTPPPRPLEPSPPPSRTPPVRPQPLPYVTPPPATLEPLPVVQQAALRRRQRRSLLLFGSLGVLAAAAVLAIVLPFFFPTRDAPRTEVRALAAAPGTLLRYFAGAGAVSALPGPMMKFPAPGKVTRIAKAGSTVAVGDVVAAVEAARSLQNQLAHQRERLAFYQQISEAMHQVGNTAEEERQAAKVEVRKARIAKTLRALAQVAVVASTAGEVEETFTREGETVEAGSLALRLRSAGHRATFDLPRVQAAEARRLGFCQVGVDGYVFDCAQAQERGDETHVSVEIASLSPTLLGRPARLARARFDGAVALPASAVLNAGPRHQVLVVSPRGRVEARPVTVAEQSPTESIVIQGLDAGENVVLDPAPDLRPGAQVSIRP